MGNFSTKRRRPELIQTESHNDCVEYIIKVKTTQGVLIAQTTLRNWDYTETMKQSDGFT